LLFAKDGGDEHKGLVIEGLNSYFWNIVSHEIGSDFILFVSENKLMAKDYFEYFAFFAVSFLIIFDLTLLVYYIFEVNEIPRTCGFECLEYSCIDRTHNIINMFHYLIFYFLPLMVIFAFCLARKLRFMNCLKEKRKRMEKGYIAWASVLLMFAYAVTYIFVITFPPNSEAAMQNSIILGTAYGACVLIHIMMACIRQRGTN